MLIRIILMCCISSILSACYHEPVEDAQRQRALQKEAVAIVQQFAGSLKPTLKKALQEGGPARAIVVCSKAAPALAKQLSAETGWTIKRVSLKARNHHTAQPDAWESSVLHVFDRQQVAGEKVANMTASTMKNGQYRFMKAQVVAPVCLHCHGNNISPNVAAMLKQYYPQDQATGYVLGQVRGAFSLRKQL